MEDDKLKVAFKEMDENNNGRVSMDEFVHWWNHDTDSVYRKNLAGELAIGGEDIKEIGTGVMFG